MNADGSDKRNLTHKAHQNLEGAGEPYTISYYAGNEEAAHIYYIQSDGSRQRQITDDRAAVRTILARLTAGCQKSMLSDACRQGVIWLERSLNLLP